MRRNWKNFYQVWIRYDETQWECVFATSAPPMAREYARNRISFGGVQRVEIRDYWGDSVLETVFDAEWEHHRRIADHIDGYDRDDLGESPDF